MSDMDKSLCRKGRGGCERTRFTAALEAIVAVAVVVGAEDASVWSEYDGRGEPDMGSGDSERRSYIESQTHSRSPPLSLPGVAGGCIFFVLCQCAVQYCQREMQSVETERDMRPQRCTLEEGPA